MEEVRAVGEACLLTVSNSSKDGDFVQPNWQSRITAVTMNRRTPMETHTAIILVLSSSFVGWIGLIGAA